MLYSDYTREQITDFVDEQKKLCSEILEFLYAGKFSEILDSCRQNCVRYEYSSRSGNILHRGLYHEGDAMEIAVSNMGRGRKLKNEPASGKAFNRYFMDKDDRLLCCEWHTSDNDVYEREFIFEIDGTKFGICHQSSGTRLHVAKYIDNKLMYTYMYSRREITNGRTQESISDICFYDYDENGRKVTASIIFNEANHLFNDLNVYHYCYNDNDAITGFRDTYGHFIPAKGTDNRQYITAPRLAAQMEKLLREWNVTDTDVYAVSAFFELNSADESAAFYIGFNTETEYSNNISAASDESEARWNYAYWLQNDKPLFEDNNVHVKYADCGGAERLLVNAIKKLRKSGVINEVFGRDIPVIIHGLEYYPELAEYNISANTKKLVPKDFIEFCGEIEFC